LRIQCEGAIIKGVGAEVRQAYKTIEKEAPKKEKDYPIQ
jgi:hypothetical protein